MYLRVHTTVLLTVNVKVLRLESSLRKRGENSSVHQSSRLSIRFNNKTANDKMKKGHCIKLKLFYDTENKLIER